MRRQCFYPLPFFHDFFCFLEYPVFMGLKKIVQLIIFTSSLHNNKKT